MKRLILFTLLTLTLIVGLFWLIKSQNDILNSHPPHVDYLTFNRSPGSHAQKTMDSWRHTPILSNPVRRIVLLDYCLILVYTTYLLWMISNRIKIEKIRRTWMASLLWAGLIAIILCSALDLIQDSIILLFVGSTITRVFSLQLLTWFKWAALATGLFILVFAFLPTQWISKPKMRGYLDNLSGFLKTIWLFFPSIVFIFLTIVCFWIRGQGKDILIAFTEAENRGFRLIFFIVIGFWVYVSWYTSRIIAHIKEKYKPFEGKYLKNYPTVAGNACFLVVELATLQVPILSHPLPLSFGLALGILAVALIGLFFADKWVKRACEPIARKLDKVFWVVLLVYVIILVITTRIHFSPEGYIWCLLGLLIMLHIIYLFYINLHRATVEKSQESYTMDEAKTLSEIIIAFFCIPKTEREFVRWLTWIGAAALLIYAGAVVFLDFARGIGPFSIVILGFAILLAFGNIITAFSVRLKINFHFLLLLMAFFIGLPESHNVRQIQLEYSKNGYDHRPTLKTYLVSWLRQRLPEGTDPYDVYFVLANGGASRSGYWTASVLGRLEDASRRSCTKDTFSNHLFCLSGTSGGGVGVAAFLSMLHDPRVSDTMHYERSAECFLGQDYFSYTLARMLGPDYFNYIFHLSASKDRAAALEQSFETYGDTVGNYNPSFYKPFSQFTAMDKDSSRVQLPILFVNTTRMQDGNPGVVTNIKVDPKYFGSRIDVMGLIKDSEMDISMASAAILGARFPYLSPAGKIDNSYFVDGGYFDNSGAGVVQELMRGIVNIAREDSLHSDKRLYSQIRRLRFRVLHITNSPIFTFNALTTVAPIQNDLFAPISTIVGAYDMQTTVNDDRLRYYINDVDSYYGIKAKYQMISLYKDTIEPSYSMNWFISDTTRNRINQRLEHHPAIDSILKLPGFKTCK